MEKFCIDDTYYETEIPEELSVRNPVLKGKPNEIRALIPGTVLKINVAQGQDVSAGDVLLVLEAMKMYNDIEAEISGRIAEISVKEGERVEKGQLMARVDPS